MVTIMNKKTKIIIAIVIIIFIGIIIANYVVNDVFYFEEWLVCKYDSQYSNYEETLRFNYVKNVLYEYEREEYLGATADNTVDDLFAFFKSAKENIKDSLSDDFKYNIEIVDDKVHIYTYIKTINQVDFYNSYIENKDITMDSTIKEVREKLSDEYTCQTIKR